LADPFTMAAVGSAAAAGGGLLSASGALGKGSADQAMYNYQAGVAKLNAGIAKQNADYTRTAGETVAYQSGLKTAEVVGQQTVSQGASGVDVNSGSPKSVRDTTTAFGQMDQSLIRTNYAKKAYGYDVEAVTKTAEAGADVVAGDQAQKAGKISAASSILGSVSSVAGKWYGASSSFGSASSGVTLYNENQQATGYVS
jgi:hypothetical protein